MSVRKSSHGTIFLIVSSGSPRALIASSLRSTSKKPFCPMTRSLHPPMTACGHRVRFVATWREEFFEVPSCLIQRTPATTVFRPVAEVVYEREFNTAETFSVLAGEIWKVSDDLSFDFGVREAWVNGHPVTEMTISAKAVIG